MVLILSDAPPAARTPWLSFQGPIPPIRGEMSRRDKGGVGMLAPKATERLSLPGTTSPSRLRRATSSFRGGFQRPLLNRPLTRRNLSFML